MGMRSRELPGSLPLMGRVLVSLFALLVVLLVGSNALARPCATLALREAVRDGSLPLSSLALQSRPTAVGHLDSPTYPIRVHYETEGVGARAPEVLTLVEDAWALLVDDMGFPAPLPDEGEGGDERFDLYLGFVGFAGALTIAHEDVSDTDGRAATYAYVHLSPTLDENAMPTFVHHEMAHVVQFALDLKESLMLAEASAVAYERLALPDIDGWADSLGDFQSYPQAPLFTNGIDWAPLAGADTLYEFGAALFLLYLEQEHGDLDGTLVRRLWEASVQPESTGENEPDWLDALADVSGASIDDLVLDFASWRVLLGAWGTADDGLIGGASLPGTALVETYRVTASALDGAPLFLPRVLGPHQLGCAALEVQAPFGEALPLHVDVKALAGEAEAPRPLGLAWVIGDPDEDRAERGRLDDVGPELSAALEVPPGDTMVLAICDLGPADADDLPRHTDVEVRLHNENVPLYDAGSPEPDGGPAADAGVPPGDAGIVCGCQQVPTRSSSPLQGKAGPFAAIRPYALAGMTVVGLLVMFLRGRAIVRRRRLYKKGSARRGE